MAARKVDSLTGRILLYKSQQKSSKKENNQLETLYKQTTMQFTTDEMSEVIFFK